MIRDPEYSRITIQSEIILLQTPRHFEFQIKAVLPVAETISA
ncbi:hypothetical protein PM8797T_24316 [Gimesia maris DSM 8797]|nr:hypothetical protein PM8797T_24316 [Gimesia maris DSM 8797]